jgi:glycosyltransferase involved in cell wall biosynthesis
MRTPQTAETAVLLATFNGEQHLAEQLASLQNQTYRAFHIFARDDGSKDDTVNLLQAYAAHPDASISLLPTASTPLGPCRSFGVLLEHVLRHAPSVRYFAFCDQDDYWLPRKLSTSIERLRAAERRDPEQPILLRSDLAVVGPGLEPIAPSFWERAKMDPLETRLSQLVFRNTSLGCASVFNRNLAQLATPLPREAVMHDWWVSLIAAAAGTIVTVPESLIQYRQHHANTVGSGDGRLRRLLDIAHWRQRILDRPNRAALAPALQAQALYKRFSGTMRETDRAQLRLFRDMDQLGPVRRRFRVLRSGVFPRDPVRLLDVMLRL